MSWLNRNSLVVRIGIHSLTWVMLLYLPYFLAGSELDMHPGLREAFWVPIVFSMILFYVNYFFIIDRFLYHKKWIVFFALNTLFILIVILLSQYVRFELISEGHLPEIQNVPGGHPPLGLFLYRDVLSFMVPIVFSIAIKTTERWRIADARMKERENERLQTELSNLRYQLQPHFFFNSLNSVYSLIDISSEQAKEAIHNLGKLMRYLLYETTTDQVSLTKEVEFMKRYLGLMKLRTPSRTVISSHFANVDESMKIAPLVFITLIENAIKHGTSSTYVSFINITMDYSDGKIIFRTENTNFSRTGDNSESSGIGLDNMLQRLELIYPGKYTFTTDEESETYRTQLTIEING